MMGPRTASLLVVFSLDLALLAAPPAAHAQQAGKVHEIVIAPPPSLEESETPPLWYLSAVRRKIEERWNRPPLSQPVAVLFTIERDGHLADLRIEATSGDSVYDDRAIKAIRSAQPFPPLPSSYSGTLMIRLELK